MQRYQGLLSFTALALLPMAVGCGGSSIEGSGVAAATAVRVETHVSAHEIDVGGRFDVRCQLLDVDGAEVAGAATFRVDPAEFVLDGLSVIPNGPGDYEVTCFSVDGVLVDETPETVTVVAGGVPRVLTRLPAETIPSCFDAVVSCEVFDAEGNIEEGRDTIVTVDPAEGVAVDGHTLRFDGPGSHEVTCALADGSLTDEEPPVIEVGDGLPVEVRTILSADSVYTGELVDVTCEVVDACGRLIELPTRIEVEAGLMKAGPQVFSLEEGTYEVACLLVEPAKPPTEDFAAELEVSEKPPDPPPPPPDIARIELTAFPALSYYRLAGNVRLIATAYDARGEEIPDVDITVVVPEGLTHQEEDSYLFEAEGVFLVTAYVTEEPDLDDELTLTCDDGPPDLVIFSPERGSTFDGDALIPVTGRVTDVGGVDFLQVNGVDIPLAADGSFAYDWPADYGLNHFWFLAKDGYNRRVKTSRACYYSSGWLGMDPPDPQQTTMLDALLVFLGQEALDDGDHDPAQIDDLATVIEILLNGFDIADLLGLGGGGISLIDTTFDDLINYTFGFLGFEFTLTGDLTVRAEISEVLFGSFAVSAIYREGGIDLIIGIEGETEEDAGIGVVLPAEIALGLELHYRGPLGGSFTVALDPPPSVHTVTSAYVHGVFVEVGIDADMPPGGDLDLAISTVEIQVERVDLNPLEDLVLALGGLDLPVIGHIDFPEIPLTNLVQGLDALIGDNLVTPLIDWVVNGLSGLLGPLLGDGLTLLVQQLIDMLALELDLPLPQIPGTAAPVTLHLSIAPASVHMDADGGTFGLAAGLTADKGVDRDPLGSILRAGCAGGDPANLAFDPAAAMQIGVLLDFVNEAIFGLWWGGGINLSLNLDDLLGGLGGGGAGGIAGGDAVLNFLLPPIVTDCTGEGTLELQIADLYLELDASALGFLSGTMTGWVSVTMQVRLLADGNTIGLEVTDDPAIELEIVETTGVLSTFESMIPSLLEDQLLPMLVDGISDTLGAIPIPEIDLGGLLPGVPAGTVLRLGGLYAETAHGYLLLGGELQ